MQEAAGFPGKIDEGMALGGEDVAIQHGAAVQEVFSWEGICHAQSSYVLRRAGGGEAPLIQHTCAGQE